MFGVDDALIGAAISGGASLFGGMMNNSANAQQANNANQLGIMAQLETQGYNTNSNREAMAFNAGQANLSRQFATGAVQQQYAQEQALQQQQGAINQGFLNQSMGFNAKQAQLQRDYETQMSSTAYQRGVRDMKAAGINPILAAGGGGASTPSGSSANVSTPSVGLPGVSAASAGSASSGAASSGSFSPSMARMENFMPGAVSSALQGAKLAGELKIQESTVQNQIAGALAANGSANASNAQAAKTLKETGYVGPQAQAAIDQANSSTARNAAETQNLQKFGGHNNTSEVINPINQVLKSLNDQGEELKNKILHPSQSPPTPDHTRPIPNPARPSPLSQSQMQDALKYGLHLNGPAMDQ